MPAKSRAALIADLIANINTNGAQAITGQILQDFLQDLTDSDLNTTTDDTDDLSEGAINEYFTDAKVNTLIEAALPGSARRIISSGSNVIAAATTVTVATLTRTAGERIKPLCMFVINDVAGAGFPSLFSVGALPLGGSDNIFGWYERTATANQFTVEIKNMNAGTSRTVEWLVAGITP